MGDKDTENNIHPRHRYNILYRIAGAASKNLQLTNTSDCIVYDPMQHKASEDTIVAYYCPLPPLSQRMTSVTSTLDTRMNAIHNIGRNEFGKNYIHSLSLADLSCLLLCGGRNMNRQAVKSVNMISMKDGGTTCT